MPSNFEAAIKQKLMSENMAGKSYKKTENTKSFIVIHNMGGTSAGSLAHWNSGAGGAYTSAHYCVDDKEIWQTLKDKWVAHHCGSPTGPAGKRGCNNQTSIGIEIADMKCDQRKAVELAIELARFLVKEHNIPYENVVAHKEVSSTDCPKWIVDNNLLDYMKTEIKRRNDEKIDLKFDPSLLQTGSSSPSSTTSNSNSTTATLPNFDNREDLINLKEIKGITLVCMPPFHFHSISSRDEEWKKNDYKKEFHYSYDGKWKTEKDKKLIAMSMQSTNRHTYIERALYSNKAFKHTLSIGIFLPAMLNDYAKFEIDLIDELSKIIYENNLKTKDLWREFDFNRSASPFMYLDREQWKRFLQEIDKQVEWRYEKYGNPTLPEKDPNTSIEDFSKLKENIGKKVFTSRYCMLRSQPNMTSPTLKALNKDEVLIILDTNKGYYKVQLEDSKEEGWVSSSSVGIIETKTSIKERTADNSIPKPEIIPTMTHKEYLAWVDLTDPKFIDDFAAECEPYDKGLKEIIDAPVNQDDRLAALTKNEITKNNNSIHYSVTEGSPGDTGHCVKPAAELNVLYKSDITKVDPIYPDLIVPPNYSPSEYNINSQNSIPLSALENNNIIKDGKDFDNNQLSFDYELLNDKKKASKGRPINYLDSYPYDDKILELEQHHPKVKIDSIESRIYESNHPGDPLPQPIAKNFALVYDSMLKQSSNIETRLVKIENVLSFVLRNLGRVGSRMNINCVYYGGQDTFGKYKTIRCLCDDRVHDACSVTLDQCLSCTRYEPILGQIYEILDDTGMNGSVFLDNMQMAYQSLDDLKNLNRVEKRNSELTFANVNKDIDKPKSKIEEWKEEDKANYINKLKSKTTDEKELDKLIENIKEEDYAFKMNWYTQDLELQEPDVKPYPLEGIKSRYKKTETGNPSAEDSENNIKDNVIDDTVDQDYIKDLTDLDKLNNGEWVDTREEADTHETNEYSSEDYYFEDFNKQSNYSDNSPGGIFGAEARNKIVEKAKEIVELHKAGKAGYSQGSPSGNRTVDDEKRIVGSNSYLKNVYVYDCSSLVSCCYKHAGLTSMYNKNTNDQIRHVVSNKGEMWLANDAGLERAKPGDLIFTTTGQIAVNQAMMGKYIPTQHVLIYIGDNKVAHASTGNSPVPKQIRIDDVSPYLKKCNFFVRPNDLIEADEKAVSTGSNSISMVNGSVNINGKSYPTLATISGAVCTPYHANTFMGGGSNYSRTGQKYKDIVSDKTITVPTESMGRSQVKYCASHNLPYGTQLYFPKLKEKGLGDGIVMVVDTGGHVFDFDINMDDGQSAKFGGKQTMDAYVLKWGEDKTIAPSYRKAASWYNSGTRQTLSTAWRTYMKMGGKLIKFHKFNQDDANANLNSSLSPID